MAHGRELEYRIGRSKTDRVSMRLRAYGPGALEPKVELFSGGLDPSLAEGTIPTGWERLVVQTSSDGGLRLFEIEPGDERNEIEHHGFYIRGPFRVARRLNSSEAAEDEFARPVDEVFPTVEAALAFFRDNPSRVTINVRSSEPPMPAPWERRMRLRGAWLYVHPENEREAIRLLAELD
jgi:hypothetical protein